MNKEEQKLIIVFQNGCQIGVRLVDVPAVVKESFSEQTGFVHNPKHTSLHLPVVEALKKWLDEHGLHNPKSSELIHTAAAIIAAEQASRTGGFVALATDDGEVMVIRQRNNENSVWRISKMIYQEITGKPVNFCKEIVSANFYVASVEEAVKNTGEEISEAVVEEEYEKAAVLRDNLNLIKSNGTVTKYVEDVTGRYIRNRRKGLRNS